MQPTTSWRIPALLPDQTGVAAADLVSPEISVQLERMKTVTAAHFSSEHDIPPSPAPLSDVEQALDMTSQSSAQIATIPFFVPEQPAPATVAETAPAYDAMTSFPTATITPDAGATPEYVQSLGLPLFLVGQNVQALQTLASSPSLLGSLVDSTGAYDQARLLTLVQTLSSGSSQAPPAPVLPTNGLYGAPPSAPSYGQTPSFHNPSTSRGGYRGGSEGNLHVSGYGPTTTQADIIAMFSPYVQVSEVVMKGTFSFVNTNDPVNAQRAREALNGTLLGGMPVRVNPAQRKSRDSTTSAYGPASGSSFSGASAAPSYGTSSTSTSAFPPRNNSFGGASTNLGGAPAPPFGTPAPPAGMPPGGGGQSLDVDSVRDDRGNAATKNLFVAGYGQGTSEESLRSLFSQHTEVIGVVSKGSFSFVNTADRASAVQARQALSGTMVNGGVLRINFAKETGRLGTSFDLTYGKNTGPHAQRSNSMSYYGRGH